MCTFVHGSGMSITKTRKAKYTVGLGREAGFNEKGGHSAVPSGQSSSHFKGSDTFTHSLLFRCRGYPNFTKTKHQYFNEVLNVCLCTQLQQPVTVK